MKKRFLARTGHFCACVAARRAAGRCRRDAVQHHREPDGHDPGHADVRRPDTHGDRFRDRPRSSRHPSAGVTVLLYTDRRIRAEAFDLVLPDRRGRAGQIDGSAVARAAPVVTTIDIDHDAATMRPRTRLRKPIYPGLRRWTSSATGFNHLLYRVASAGSSFPGGWLTLTVLAIVAVVAVVVAVRIARRTMRTQRDDSFSLFDTHELQLRPSTGPPQDSMRQRTGGPQRSGTGCARWPDTSKEAGFSVPTPGVPRRSSRATRGGPARPDVNSPGQRARFNDVTYGERPRRRTGVPRHRRARQPALRHRGATPSDAAAAHPPPSTAGRRCDEATSAHRALGWCSRSS